jgi:2-succinyl-6-hydroxy-2,4-cyclohexadiene-1-carboxylate synthase
MAGDEGRESRERALKLHREIHPGQGPFLLLVHGILLGRSLWGPNLAGLARVSRPVIVELWGHGRSPSPQEPALYDPRAYVAAFEEIRAELGAERWLVCGQSFGAALTLRYALDHPERLIAQIFTNSTSALADREWAARTRAAAPAFAETIEREGRPALERMPIHPQWAKHLPASTREAVLADAAIVDPRGVARTLRYGVPESSVRERVGENRVQTLLVCGERESRFQPLREFAERQMPLLEVAPTDAGHAVNLEAADAFDAAVIDFLHRATG